MGTNQTPHWRQRFGKIFKAGRGFVKRQESSRSRDPPRAPTAKAAASVNREFTREEAIEEAKKKGRQEFDESDLEAGVGPAYIRKRPKEKRDEV